MKDKIWGDYDLVWTKISGCVENRKGFEKVMGVIWNMNLTIIFSINWLIAVYTMSENGE